MLLLDGFEIFGREGTAVGEVVVETVVDDRTDRDLRFGIQVLRPRRPASAPWSARIDVEAIGVLVR